MAQDAYALTRDTVERLRRDLYDLERRVVASHVQMRSRRPRHVASSGGTMRVAITESSGVAARSAVTPGQGEVTFYTFDGTNLAPTSAPTQVVYNLALSAVAANTLVLVEQDAQGYWWVIVEDCGI